MVVLDVGTIKRYAIYWAVRLGGWWAWSKNRSKKRNPI